MTCSTCTIHTKSVYVRISHGQYEMTPGGTRVQPGLRISEALSLTRDAFDQRQKERPVIGKDKHVRQIFISNRFHFKT